MGFFFDAKSANIVGYLTASNPRPPRVTVSELTLFLGIFTDAGPPVSAWISEALVSSSPEWIEEVTQAGLKAYDDLAQTKARDWDAPVPADELTTRLAVLHRLLSDYNLFALAVGDWNDDVQLRAFINYAAISSGHRALFLAARGWNNLDVQLRDPFPAVASALRRTQDWPGVVFWTKSSQSAFATLREAADLYQALRHALESPKELEAIS